MPDYYPVPARRLSPAPVQRATFRQLAAVDQGEVVARAVISAETSIARARVESLVDVTESAVLGASAVGSVTGCLLTGAAWTDRAMVSIAEEGFAGLRRIVRQHAHGEW